LRKNSALHLILGGAAVHRCDNCVVLNAASAAEVTVPVRERLSPQSARQPVTTIGDQYTTGTFYELSSRATGAPRAPRFWRDGWGSEGSAFCDEMPIPHFAGG
jgi:hypothetical protein